MEAAFLSGRNYPIAKLKAIVASGPTHVHEMFFDRLFPGAKLEMKARALVSARNHFFSRMEQSGPELLLPSIGYLREDGNLLITNEERLLQLSTKAQVDFTPVVVLESRSHRARMLINGQGEIQEYKGLTPIKYDLRDINRNSSQPQNLLGWCFAKNECLALQQLGVVRSAVISLGEIFPDLTGFGQLLRAPNPGDRYYPFVRFDRHHTTYELLASLEGIPFEEYLYQSGVRLGKQLRELHGSGQTLHNPFREESAPEEPFFSPCHTGNIAPGGVLIDLEGARAFSVAEQRFNDIIRARPELRKSLPAWFDEERGKSPFSHFSMASDLQRLLGGRNARLIFEPDFFDKFYRESKRPSLFQGIASGLLRGYYAAGENSGPIEEIVKELMAYLAKQKFGYFSYALTYSVLRSLDKKQGAT